jgi:hypothetical protein
MIKPSLYEVGVEGAEIEALLIESDGELTPELEARLDAHLATGKNKIIAAAMVVRQLETSEGACVVEANRLLARAESFKRQAAMLKARMLFAVDNGFDGKLKTDLFTIWGQTSAPTVAFDVAPDAELTKIAEEYPSLIRTKQELDRKRLGEMYKAGEALPIAISVDERPGTRYLRIK